MPKPLIERLYDALKQLHDNQADYVQRNKLGLPHDNADMQQALIAMKLYEEHCANYKGQTMDGSQAHI